MKKKLAFLLLSMILLAACAGTNPLSDTSWALVSYGSVDNPTLAQPDILAYISFSADGNLKGDVGCNGFSGSYEVSGDKLTIGPIMSTLMGCESPRMEQETGVLTLLNGTLVFEINGGDLTIFSDDGISVMHFIHSDN